MCSELRVAQLIYGRVEAAYSPQRKSGYQTVCHSTSLTASDVNEIERRVQCFQQQANIGRRQFFQIGRGQLVISHTKLLTEPNTTIIDSSGRIGAFITHCLVLTPVQFTKFDNNPFLLFEHYPFQSDPEGIVAHIEQTASDGYHTQVRIAPPPILSSYWSLTEARKLVGLTLQAEEMIKKGQSILMVGDQEDIFKALYTAFMLMPLAKRPTCSFDTCIDRCSVRPGDYWAVGVSTRQSYSSYINVNVKEHYVATDINIPDNDELYLSWLGSVAHQGAINTAFIKRAITIQALSCAFNAGIPLPDSMPSDEALPEFFERYHLDIIQNLKTAIKRIIDTTLSERLIDYVYRRMVHPNDFLEVLNIAAQKSMAVDVLSEWLVDWLLHKQPSLKERDWKDILEILEDTHTMKKMERLESYIRVLDDAKLHALEKCVRNRVNIPDRCRKVIQMRRGEIGSRSRLSRFLKRG